MTKGAEVLKALELYGNPKLNRLTLPDLVALLTNAEKQENETNSKNKSKAMLRVRALSSVQAPLSRCALAIAVMHAQASALAPTHAIVFPPQSLRPSEEYIEGLRLSFGSIGSSSVVKLPSAPVRPDAN